MDSTLTVKEAAERANVSRSLIYALLRQRRLAASRIGCRGKGCWRIDAEELARWLEGCKQAPGPLAPLKHIR